MPSFPPETWFLLVAVSVAAGLVVPYTVAALIRDRTAVIDLKRRVERLRREYEAHIANVQIEENPQGGQMAHEQAEPRAAA